MLECSEEQNPRKHWGLSDQSRDDKLRRLVCPICGRYHAVLARTSRFSPVFTQESHPRPVLDGLFDLRACLRLHIKRNQFPDDCRKCFQRLHELFPAVSTVRPKTYSEAELLVLFEEMDAGRCPFCGTVYIRRGTRSEDAIEAGYESMYSCIENHEGVASGDAIDSCLDHIETAINTWPSVAPDDEGDEEDPEGTPQLFEPIRYSRAAQDEMAAAKKGFYGLS